MKYDDLSSLVQLGVGVHAGTALLQLYGDFGAQPLIRTITRIRSLLVDEKEGPSRAVEDDLNKIESDFDIFKIQLFNEYKKYVKINFFVAFLLVVILIVIAYNADDPIAVCASALIIALSVLPAPLTLGLLWRRGTRAIRHIEKKADELESRVLKGR